MTDDNTQQEYRVLARKYRPQNFDELIGQDALVRTLTNAIETNRIAHAFMLTGVRGVGKTTTARIIAKALNYTGPDGKSGATTGDTSDCQLCQAITEDRHPDVIEMDAASRTGVDDVREILDGVRYAPTEARYKVYIIDEVHMLSKQAFNALLKTLEEPPPHVKFIFATTEIRKVPITVLSRCQRFDLRRVDVPTLSAHFAAICEQEQVQAEGTALDLIARAADGSVRDGLSILDRAISVGQSQITADDVQAMLGLTDKAANLDILDHVLKGETAEALDILDRFYTSGADPINVMQDLLDLTHLLTRSRAVDTPADKAGAMLSADTMARAQDMAKSVSMPALTKCWQMLLKGLQEVQSAPSPQIAAEMVIIRLCYAANLPDPQDLIKSLKKKPSDSVNIGQPPISAPAAPMPQPSAPAPSPMQVQPTSAPVQNAPPPTSASLSAVPAPQNAPVTSHIESLQDIVDMLECGNEIVLASALSFYAEPVKVEQGLLEIALRDGAGDKIKTIASALRAIQGKPWMVSFVPATGIPTLSEQKKAAEKAEYDAIINHADVQKILSVFEGATVSKITDIPQEKE